MTLEAKAATVRVVLSTFEQMMQILTIFLQNRMYLTRGYAIEVTGFEVIIDDKRHAAAIYESMDEHGNEDHLLVCATIDTEEQTLLFTLHREGDRWYPQQRVLATTFSEFIALNKKQQCEALGI